jgi:uncharacterized protein
MKAAYLDSSAIVKLVVREAESSALRRYLRRRGPLLSSALARTEVLRSLLRAGPAALVRGQDALACLDLVRLGNRVLDGAGMLPPPDLRSLDAIHLATAQQLAEDLGPFITYDERMAAAGRALGLRVVSPR